MIDEILQLILLLLGKLGRLLLEHIWCLLVFLGAFLVLRRRVHHTTLATLSSNVGEGELMLILL